MYGDYPLSYQVGDGQVWTFGLSFLGHPELTTRATTLGEVREAQLTLFSLASLVIASNTRLQEGDAIDLGHKVVCLEAGEHGQLEVRDHPRLRPGSWATGRDLGRQDTTARDAPGG